jgi:flavin-dependent dehydrogenase
MAALGYYVPGERHSIDVQLMPPFEGYIWVFPRCGHLSVGICGKGEAAGDLRQRVESFMQDRGIPREGAKFYSHLLPSLDRASWAGNNVAGDGWLAAGDAAGLVDPITGEGIYYAIRSADLAAQTLIEAGGDAADYRRRLRADFTADLELGATLSRRLYAGKFVLRPVWDRIVQFSKASPRFAGIIVDLLAGEQPYGTLKRRLWRNLPGTLAEIARAGRY